MSLEIPISLDYNNELIKKVEELKKGGLFKEAILICINHIENQDSESLNQNSVIILESVVKDYYSFLLEEYKKKNTIEFEKIILEIDFIIEKLINLIELLNEKKHYIINNLLNFLQEKKEKLYRNENEVKKNVGILLENIEYLNIQKALSIFGFNSLPESEGELFRLERIYFDMLEKEPNNDEIKIAYNMIMKEIYPEDEVEDETIYPKINDLSIELIKGLEKLIILLKNKGNIKKNEGLLTEIFELIILVVEINEGGKNKLQKELDCYISFKKIIQDTEVIKLYNKDNNLKDLIDSLLIKVDEKIDIINYTKSLLDEENRKNPDFIINRDGILFEDALDELGLFYLPDNEDELNRNYENIRKNLEANLKDENSGNKFIKSRNKANNREVNKELGRLKLAYNKIYILLKFYKEGVNIELNIYTKIKSKCLEIIDKLLEDMSEDIFLRQIDLLLKMIDAKTFIITNEFIELLVSIIEISDEKGYKNDLLRNIIS